MAYTTIDDPSAYFQTTLWTGDGNDDRSITNIGNSDLQPDFVWIKSRGTTNDHILFDSTRGVGNYLRSNDVNDETTIADTLQAFESDGIQIGTNSRLNTSADPVVSWQWKANGGTTSSNTDGSITSTVQADTTAGFSIVTYTGNGTVGATVGHGLGVAPKIVFIKNRDATSENWAVSTENITGTTNGSLKLNLTTAEEVLSVWWNGTAPSSSVITIGNAGNVNTNTENYVAYCFAEKQGYSKIGEYTGNNSTDGSFIYTGFKPVWTMIKNTQTAGYNWVIQDTKRFGGINSGATDKNLAANSNSAEPSSASFAGNEIDYLSNGFKLRSTAGNTNSAQSYIYMAFAEHPFVSSTGTPTTAR